MNIYNSDLWICKELCFRLRLDALRLVFGESVLSVECHKPGARVQRTINLGPHRWWVTLDPQDVSDVFQAWADTGVFIDA